ncbi:MAG: cytochrome b [Bdellovibrionales bacterium]
MTNPSYDKVAKTFHWLIALAILGMLALGWTMGDAPNGPGKSALYGLHKSIGIAILLLSLLRLGWRLAHSAPPMPSAMKTWEKALARIVHGLLYVLMIGIPLSGWAMVSTSSRNFPTVLFGLVPLPHLPIISTLANKQEINEFAHESHELLAYGMVALLVLHVAAALKHHWIDRDDVLTRIAPRIFTGFLDKLRCAKTGA